MTRWMTNLPSLVAELQEKLKRQRSTRKSERDIDWWDHALASQADHKTGAANRKEILYPSPSKDQVLEVKREASGRQSILREANKILLCPPHFSLTISSWANSRKVGWMSGWWDGLKIA